MLLRHGGVQIASLFDGGIPGTRISPTRQLFGLSWPFKTHMFSWLVSLLPFPLLRSCCWRSLPQFTSSSPSSSVALQRCHKCLVQHMPKTFPLPLKPRWSNSTWQAKKFTENKIYQKVWTVVTIHLWPPLESTILNHVEMDWPQGTSWSIGCHLHKRQFFLVQLRASTIKQLQTAPSTSIFQIVGVLSPPEFVMTDSDEPTSSHSQLYLKLPPRTQTPRKQKKIQIRTPIAPPNSEISEWPTRKPMATNSKPTLYHLHHIQFELIFCFCTCRHLLHLFLSKKSSYRVRRTRECASLKTLNCTPTTSHQQSVSAHFLAFPKKTFLFCLLNICNTKWMWTLLASRS